MPPKKRTLTQAEQSARFIEVAKKIGADESGKAFEKAFKKIVRKKNSSKERTPPDS
jgi:hypothetical protein